MTIFRSITKKVDPIGVDGDEKEDESPANLLSGEIHSLMRVLWSGKWAGTFFLPPRSRLLISQSLLLMDSLALFGGLCRNFAITINMFPFTSSSSMLIRKDVQEFYLALMNALNEELGGSSAQSGRSRSRTLRSSSQSKESVVETIFGDKILSKVFLFRFVGENSR